MSAVDEFAHHTSDSKAGILALRSLEPLRLLALARADEWELDRGEGPEPAQGAYDEIVEAAGGRPINPTWVTSRAAEAAYGRDLIEADELDWITR